MAGIDIKLLPYCLLTSSADPTTSKTYFLVVKNQVPTKNGWKLSFRDFFAHSVIVGAP